MKVIIAGSRQLFQDNPPIYYVGEAMALAKQEGITPTLVVSGGARGVDKAGEEWAGENNLPIKRFTPDWDGLGKGAGLVRNNEMADYADALVAVRYGGETSRGTTHMINVAKVKGLLVLVMDYESSQFNKPKIWTANCNQS